jgi:hypothetical protein
MGTFNDLLDRLRGKVKITPEEAAKRKARQDAINRYSVDSRKHVQYLMASLGTGVNIPAPVFQNYLDDPNYVWDFTPPNPPRPRPI